MIKLNSELLSKLGLFGLPGNVIGIALAVVRSGLEARVGTSLAERMSDDQLELFEEFIDAEDDERALAWLATNFPDYRSVVEEQFLLVTRGLEETSGALLRTLLSGR